MRRLAVLLLVVTACAGESGPVDSTTIAGPVETTTPGASTTTGNESATSTTTTLGHDRELAPDFTLDLAEGGSFTLSEGAKPVYLVFWAEWCPVCRRELPIVDRIAAEYADRVDFVAPVWKSGEQAAIEAAAVLFPSGTMMWGMDSEEVIFGLYGVPYQPVTVLIASDKTVVEAWAGVRSEDGVRQSLEELLELS